MSTPHLTWFSLYWLGWIVAFLVPELYWLYANPANTLSREVWSIEGLNMGQPWDFPMWTDVHWVVAIVVWGLFLWLSLHLPFGMLR